ncbi:molybdenum cofactor guanylyltransferase [Hyphococcus luteus]|uniref:molybdenum cofactor guanylyltransferase n=1 Tax=Hyphococcus luteus TaxID=2058213 RepID=UPI0013FD1D4C|nr:molybdenum cofactor guanylyltransferase [Marinicaulis flavus]
MILSGGGGRRMGGADKGALKLLGERMIDRAAARLTPQVDRILISGPHDYGTGLTALPDLEDGPLGPAAGLWAALKWIEENAPQADGFLTAPADGPFAPDDLFKRLSAQGKCVIAATAGGVHPTFAWWRNDALRAALDAAPKGEGLSLKALAAEIGARRVLFADEKAFLNINTPEDLKRAEDQLRG